VLEDEGVPERILFKNILENPRFKKSKQ